MISVQSPDASQLETATQWPVWEKEICNFDEDYTAREMFYILDGEARLTTRCGIDQTIRQGDLVTVEAGVLVNWDIRQPIRKHFKFF
ncbi:cupin domain-containing protein [Aliamphritea hakodatensis]|uniref:cupin domain-containing protein n=1 Tax=Aliamphritea hakodatensis TaxID=2895352 RepID=UPI0022FD5B65|nr:cupin domain-containing protein [Aliamphritea hakodatensis]